MVASKKTMLGMLAILAARRLQDAGADSGGSAGTVSTPLPLPSARVPAEVGLDLWRRLPTATGQEAVGLQLAGRAPVSAFHLLGTAVASAPHLCGAVQVFCRYFPYLCMSAHLVEEITGDIVTVTWDDGMGSAPRSLRDFVLVELTGVLASYGVHVVRPVRVTLTGPAPGARRLYEDAFQCPVEFDQPQSALVLRTVDLALPLYGSNPALHTAVTHRLGAFDRSRTSRAARVVGALEQLLDAGEVRIERVAEVLGMSPRSVQKQLAAEGCRFSELLRRVRQRRALTLLRETETPVSAVALALGYGDVGSFSRAFHEWFGHSPAAFRQSSGHA